MESRSLMLQLLTQCALPLTLAGLLGIASNATGALVSGGDVNFSWTTDTATGLDWLDLDGGAAPSTIGRSYNEVAAQLNTGGDYSGWRFASRAQVYKFVLDATGLPSLVQAPFTSVAQDGATDAVALWTGYSRRDGTLDVVGGFTGDVSSSGVYYAMLFDYFIQPDQTSEYTIWIPGTEANTTGSYIDLGSWLIRGDDRTNSIVPEPATIALACAALLAMVTVRRRKLTTTTC